MVGVSAVLGLSGSITFPQIRRKIGLAKSGLLGFACIICCLILPVLSIWIDGSPFEPYYFMINSNKDGLVKNDSSKSNLGLEWIILFN